MAVPDRPAHDTERSLLLEATRITARDAFIGMAAGTRAEIGVAVAFRLWRGVEQPSCRLALTLRGWPAAPHGRTAGQAARGGMTDARA
ncbi:hypothetical protein GCM10010170_025330 [Dactylosporangium salmoneum]|uniref:Uncharacterized protein n=1 Tax=Dactylosporangium salmoneum TaxID=53361 RepID=A0ABN3G0P6_9ACTN